MAVAVVFPVATERMVSKQAWRGGRIAQEVYGLAVKGTAGVLVEAKRRQIISDVRPMLLALREAGYFIADNVIVAACQAVGE